MEVPSGEIDGAGDAAIQCNGAYDTLARVSAR